MHTACLQVYASSFATELIPTVSCEVDMKLKVFAMALDSWMCEPWNLQITVPSPSSGSQFATKEVRPVMHDDDTDAEAMLFLVVRFH